MKKYLHKFENLADFETAYNGNDYYEPWVSLTDGIPTKITVVIDNLQVTDPNCILTYGNETTTISWWNSDDDNFSGIVYLWNMEADGSSMGVWGSENRVIQSGDKIFQLSLEYGEWRYVGSFDITNVEIIERNRGKVDYNKHPFTGDLIVEWVNKGRWEDWDITYANSDYFGELTCDGNCNEVVQYTCSGPISEGTGKNPLKVRVINAEGEQKDYVFGLDYNGFPETNSMEWRCSDSSCPIYVTYADYSGGSPIVLKANEV